VEHLERPRGLTRRAHELLESVSMADRQTMPVASLPHGDQRKLEVALLMALEPQVYMFDEPTAGMSHDEAPVILNLIRRSSRTRPRPSCWSNTRWMWCANSPTASSC
jgi:branched-chain amino acid transport system ATP-binding protein